MSFFDPKKRVHQTKPVGEEREYEMHGYGLRHDVGQFLNAQPICTEREGAKGFDVKKPGGNKRGY